MKPRHRLIRIGLVLALGSVSAGCAMSGLDVRVDVYAEDPLLASFADPERLAGVRHSLRRAQTNATEIADQRKADAEDVVSIVGGYLAIIDSINVAKDPDAPRTEAMTGGLGAERVGFARVIDERLNTVSDRTEGALGTLDEVEAIADRWRDAGSRRDAAALIDAFAELDVETDGVAAAFKSLITQDTTFDEMVGDVFNGTSQDDPGLLKDLQRYTTEPTARESDEVREAIASLVAEVRRVTEERRMRAETATKSLEALTLSTDRLSDALDNGETGEIGRLLTETARAARATTTSPGFREGGREIIRDVAASGDFLTSQLDRVQDSADPAWRELRKDANKHKWLPGLAEAGFYAEGNNQVILVQDRVGHFRVARAQNNPAALIRGQSRISRSIASGALDVLAAAGGVAGVPGLSKLGGLADDPAPSDVDGGASQRSTAAEAADRSARRTAEAERFARQRTALIAQLRRIRAGIAASDVPVTDEQLEDLRAVLTAYEELLSEPGSDTQED